jgi:hypothetical protein
MEFGEECHLLTAAHLKPKGRAAVRFHVLSGGLDVATIAFEFDFRDRVKRHAHFLEPGLDGVLAFRFHDADGFAFGQIGEAAITFDGRILLRRLRKLAELVGGEFPCRHGVSAHEFCHGAFPFWFVGFLSTSLRGRNPLPVYQPGKFSCQVHMGRKPGINSRLDRNVDFTMERQVRAVKRKGIAREY